MQPHGFICVISPTVLKLGKGTIPINCQVRRLGLNYSCTMNFSDNIHTQVVKANRLVGSICGTLKLKECKLRRFRTHVRNILEYCSTFCSNSVAVENVQCVFAKYFSGYPASLTVLNRCELLELDPLWLRRQRAKPMLFNIIITRGSCITFFWVRGPLL